MTRLAHDCVRCAAKIYDAIGTTTDIGLRDGRIGPQLLTHSGRTGGKKEYSVSLNLSVRTFI